MKGKVSCTLDGTIVFDCPGDLLTGGKWLYGSREAGNTVWWEAVK